MPRQAISLSCNKKDRAELERLSRSRTESKQLVDRANIILDCLEGKRNKDIAATHKTQPNRITKWRSRFAKLGLAGLLDLSRPGRPIKNPDLQKRILELLEMPPPKGQACWDGKALATSLGAKAGTVWRILRKNGIQLQRTRSWVV